MRLRLRLRLDEHPAGSGQRTADGLEPKEQSSPSKRQKHGIWLATAASGKGSRLWDPCLDICILHTSLLQPLISSYLTTIHRQPTSLPFSPHSDLHPSSEGRCPSHAERRQASSRSATGERPHQRGSCRICFVPSPNLHTRRTRTASLIQPAEGKRLIISTAIGWNLSSVLTCKRRQACADGSLCRFSPISFYPNHSATPTKSSDQTVLTIDASNGGFPCRD